MNITKLTEDILAKIMKYLTKQDLLNLGYTNNIIRNRMKHIKIYTQNTVQKTLNQSYAFGFKSHPIHLKLSYALTKILLNSLHNNIDKHEFIEKRIFDLNLTLKAPHKWNDRTKYDLIQKLHETMCSVQKNKETTIKTDNDIVLKLLQFSRPITTIEKELLYITEYITHQHNHEEETTPQEGPTHYNNYLYNLLQDTIKIMSHS